ncbi:MAG: hypothetical protein FWF25_02570, partial [Propionibacteriaceae bacterium]|nr:hypothetical protein [Propionibacteriaceae bacterium]
MTIGNNLLTCPDTNDTCQAAKAGQAKNNNNNQYAMINLDADSDPSTINSSMSSLSLPEGATVLWAGLYWGARLKAGSGGTDGHGNFEQMSLRAPGESSYQTIQASTDPDALFGPYTAASAASAYQRFADVTDVVRQAGSGDYWGANVVAATGEDRYAGWSLVVAYSAPGLPLRNLTVFDGFINVGSSSTPTIQVSGFQAPLAGAVDTGLTMVAYEGDMTQTGDYTQLNGTQLATALSPGNNFFNSTNDMTGVSVSTRIPADKNMFGYDIKNISTSGIIPNGATSATFTFGSTGDAYYPGVLTTAINLYAPDFITSTKTAVNLSGHTPAQPGDVIQYTIRYANTGQDPATDLVSTDPIPEGAQYVPGSLRLVDGTGATIQQLSDASDSDVGDFTGSAVQVHIGAGATGTTGGTLVVGAAPQAYSFQARVTQAAGGQTVTNLAHLSYRTATTGVTATYDTPPASIDVVPVADVSITKDLSVAGNAIGGAVTATLTVTNHGPNTATGIQVSDPIEEGWLNPVADTTDAPAATHCAILTPRTGSSVLSCTVPDLANGDSAVIHLTGTISPSLPASSWTLANIARVDTTTFDPDPSNNISSATATLTQQADLSITKTASPGPFTPGTQVTYTLTATNNGPSDATGVNLTDVVPSSSTSVLSLVSATPGAGLTCPASAFTATGFTCTADRLTVGQTVTVAVKASVDAAATQGTLVANTATISSAVPDPDTTNNTATATSTVAAPSADMTVAKQTTQNPVIAGTPITYTLTATNQGPSNAINAVVTDDVPSTITAVKASTDTGTCTVTGQTVSCAIGSQPDLSTPVGKVTTITVTGVVSADITGTLTNTATVTSDSTDPDHTNNQSTTHTQVNGQADLSVTKTASQTTLPARAGEEIDYTITIHNAGPSQARGVTLADIVPLGLDLAGAADYPAGVTCDSAFGTPDATGSPWNCTLGDLAVGQTIQITLPTQATGPETTTMTETVTVASTTPDPNTDNNTASWQLTDTPQADLSIDKTATPATFSAGGTGTFQLTVTNHGPNEPVATVTDTLPDGLVLVPSTDAGSQTSPECTADATGTSVTCTDPQPFTDQESRTYTLMVSVSPNLTDQTVVSNTARVTGDITDPSTDNNISTVRVPITAEANLKVSSLQWEPYTGYNQPPSADPANAITSTQPGSMLWLSMVITNDGPATAQNTSFSTNYDFSGFGVSLDMVHPVLVWNDGTSWVTADAGCQITQSVLSCTLDNSDPSIANRADRTSILPGQSVTVGLLLGVYDWAPASTDRQAWVSVSTTTPETTTQDNFAEITLPIGEGQSHLQITKTAAPGTGPGGALVAGSTFSYTINVWQERDASRFAQGLSWAEARDVVVSDALPQGFHATSASSSQGTCAVATGDDQQVSCAVGSIPGTIAPGPYRKVTITIVGTIDPNVSATTAVNTAEATTSTPSDGPFQATASVDIARQADLRLVKFVDTSPVIADDGSPVFVVGGQVGYTLTAFNAGPSNSGASTITDTLPAGLTLDPAASTSGCTAQLSSGGAPAEPQVVVCPVGPLAVGASQTVRIVATTSALDTRQPGTGPGCIPGDPSQPDDNTSTLNPAGCDVYPSYPRDIDNTASITAGTSAVTDPDLANNDATASATLQTQADLATWINASSSTPVAGGTVTFTTVTVNQGPSVADYPFSDVSFPAGFTPVSFD